MEYMGLKFDDTTGLLLNLNKASEEIRDTLKEYLSNDKKDNKIKQIEKENTKAIIKSNDKNNKLLVKNSDEYNKKIAKNLKEVSKKKKLKVDVNGKLRDEKGRFVKQEKTASEKAKETQDKQNNKSEKIEVKVPAEEIGEAVGDAYYQSYQELKTFFTPFIESTKSVFQFFSKRLFSKDDEKDIKNASEKATKDNVKKDNTTKKLLENSKKELSTDEKILKELKHHRPKSKLNLGSILGILRKILLGLAPLGSMWGYIKNKLKLPLSKNKQTTQNKKKQNPKNSNKDNNNKNKQTKKQKSGGIYTNGEKNEREVKKRKPPKSRKRIQIPEKVEKKAGLKVGAKIGGKIASKFIPILGWGMMAYDVFNTAKDIYNGSGVVDSFKKNFLGIETETKEKKLSKKEVVKIKETKEAIANSKNVLKPNIGNKYNYTPISNKTTWRDNSPDVKKQEIVKKEIQTKDTTNKLDLSVFKNQITISDKILQEQKKTNDLLNTLLSKTSGKTITYNPAKHSLRSE